VILTIVGTAYGKKPEQPSDQAQAAKPSEVSKFSWPKGVPRGLLADLDGGVKMEFVLIPTGSFMMGDDNGEDCEKPAHKVTIAKPFYFGKYVVTQEQWEAVMGANPSHFKGPRNPVEMVSWYDCQKFLEKLNEKLGSRGAMFRLPTEAQWEYACRAGTTTQYSFGDAESALGDYAWWAKNSDGTIHPMGQKKPNAWGLYDMHGSVWEWCAEPHGHDYYAKSPVEDPTGPASGLGRVSRGGSWDSFSPEVFRCAYRNAFRPDQRVSVIGFRVVRTVTP
jgi:formylglycine-generating enzyme required for sulfatase activity